MDYMDQKNTLIGTVLIIVLTGAALYMLAKQPELPPHKDITPVTMPGNQTYGSVVEANNQFAVDLYQRYRSKDGNMMFSPFSISSALAMTYEGARGRTAEEMRNVMHFPGDIGVLRSGYSSIYDRLNRVDRPYKLSTANSLWAQKDYPFVADYFGTVEKYYDGKVTNLDFKSDTENSRKTINQWVEDKTYDRIKDIIPEGFLSPMTRLVLTNALYFNASWLSTFEDAATDDREFKTGTGSSVKARMMHKTGYYNYGETGVLQILEMPYEGDDLSMLVILPKGDRLQGLESSISTANLADWKNSMKQEYVELSLPKFKYENKYFMAQDLKAMGMPTAFTYPAADFTGMSPTKELYIDEVIHQTFIEVSESGTEAAAATAVIMVAGASPVHMELPEPKIFNADHPFIFLIQEKSSGNILFMGRLTDPSK